MKKPLLILSLVLAAIPAMQAQQVILVNWNASWKYMQPMGVFPTVAGSNFDTTWFLKESDFTAQYVGPTFGAVPSLVGNNATANGTYDSGVGNGPLGYGAIDYVSSPNPAPAEFGTFATMLTTPLTGAGRYTGYFRTTFTVPAGGLLSPHFRYILDDGGFVYLDGVKILNVNMASGAADTYTLLCPNTTDTESQIRDADLGLAANSLTGGSATANIAGNATVLVPVTVLAAGQHTLAISDHNQALTSSDIILAVQVTGQTGINAAASNIVRGEAPGGDPSEPIDDNFTFDVTVTQVGGTGTTWTSDFAGINGTYGVPKHVGPFDTIDGDVTLHISDSGNPAITTTLVVSPPPVFKIGTRNFGTGDVNVLTTGPIPVAWVIDETAKTASQNGTGGTTPQVFRTAVQDLSGVSGPVLGFLQLHALETSATSNFETTDMFKAELILNDGVNSSTVNLITAFDKDANGFLNGYSGTSQADYDANQGKDEFNVDLHSYDVGVDHTFDLGYVIPDNIVSAQFVISGNNDSTSEHFAVENLMFTLADSDNDGLIDLWEIANFGNLGQTATGDPDGDGYSNLLEYQTGTNPNDANDHFSYGPVTSSGGNISLSWSSKPGKVYGVFTSTNLTSWIQSGANIPSAGATTSATVPAPGNRTYYTVRVIP